MVEQVPLELGGEGIKIKPMELIILNMLSRTNTEAAGEQKPRQ